MILILLYAFAAPVLAADNSLSGKKLVEYGWDVPTTAYVHEHIRDMEKVPFDGVTIYVAPPTNSNFLSWRVFSKTRFEPNEYESAITDLRSTKFEHLTDNFIGVIAMPGDVDWFDPDWSAVAHNAACLARVAKQGGCKGFLFDPEDYGKYHIWSYKQRPLASKAAHSYEDYYAQARKRGREFIQAVNQEFPDISILTCLGPSVPYADSQRKNMGITLKGSDYALLMAFYDGICEGASPGTTLIDGWEASYTYRERSEFAKVRDTILNKSKTISTVPDAYAKHVRVGLGIWTDGASNSIGWFKDDFSKNYFTPAGYRASLAYAMQTSDKYVWVYSEKFKWWDLTAPKAYMEALALAKTGPGPGELHPVKLPAARAEAAQDYKDDKTFAEMRKTKTEIADLPKDGWSFKPDEKNTGQKLGWYKPDFDDSTWHKLSIGKYWQEQDEKFETGKAWYRRKFTAPEFAAGKRVFLAFGAVDESAWVWLNGKFVGAHDTGGNGFNTPFALDVTNILIPGQPNSVAVLVLNRYGAGGIWKSVKLMSSSR